MSLYDSHKDILDRAVKALHERTFWAQYPEHPSPKIYGEDADKSGQEKFKAQMGKKYDELLQADPENWIGVEESPYLQAPLNIEYPAFSVDTLISRSESAYHAWRKVSAEDRAGILIESLERMKSRFFEVAYATMHTTGQGYMMAFQASGPHAADRALEAIASGYEELGRFPSTQYWDKPMGKFNIQLDKEWRAVPKGVSLVIGCSTFPTWNTVPGMYASLITGNPVIVKPHPGAVLPIALVIAELQQVLKEQGLPVDICQLAVDSFDNMITKELAEHSAVKLIDYTGNSAFGDYLEGIPGKAVFTEKTGVNSVILDSVDNIDKVVQNITFSVALYSGQMCTAPQNFFVPENGIKTPDGVVSFEEFAQKFADFTTGLVENPKAGPFVLGTIQNKKTLGRIDAAKELGGKVWLESRTLENPMFKNARTATPMVLELSSADKDKFAEELFGPIALLIKTKDTKESVALAKEMAQQHGAISCGAYTTDAETREMIADEMSLAATPVSFNLTGGIYVNQNASFSDFHVTGGNPAGNASFTNPEYVVKRFTWVGIRMPAEAKA
ncbi:MAG: phenylacetic acid degradation protein PaaN [Bacteroidota bacterium]